jgi:transcriptional regulator with XRE-family HTH domain
MNVTKNIRKAFKASGMSLTEFANLAGVRVSTAHGWVHGKHSTRLARLPLIAKILETTVGELVA